MRQVSILFLCAVVCGGAQPPVRNTTFEDRPAVQVENDRLELTVLTEGGAIARLLLREDAEKLNPFWEPVRMARESGRRQPSGSVMGHFVCVDGFGPVSREERAAGLPGHGEAHTVPWEISASRREGGTTSVTFVARLPLVQEVLTRTFRMIDGENVVYVESELENLLAFDRPVCWAEHATIGSPFLEPAKTVVDMPAERAKTRDYSARETRHRLASFQDFTWPMAPGVNGQLIDLRAAPLNPDSGDHTTCLMDRSRKLVFFTALRPDKQLVLGYLFKPEEYPWVQNWEEYPANLKLARGLEFSTQPFDVPRRQAIDTHLLFGAPTYRWLPAKSKIASRFLFFYAKTPTGFTKIDDVTLENGRVVIEDRGAGRRLELKAARPL